MSRVDAYEKALLAAPRIVEHYASLGRIAFVYAKGSLVEALAEAADLDVTVVWSDRPPAPDRRLPVNATDTDPACAALDDPGFNIDRFWIAGQEYEVQHVTLEIIEDAAATVERGGGVSGYPMPVITIHSLVNGDVLFDPDSFGSQLQTRLAHVPRAFVAAATRRARESAPRYTAELELAVERGDGLLFHSLTVELMRTLFIAWFARHDRYWPLEKRLTTRLQRSGYGDLAELETSVWSAPDLAARLVRIQELIDALRPEP